MAIFTQYLTTLYFHPTDLAAILDFCQLRKMPQWDFSGLFFWCSVDLKEMHCGQKKSIAILPFFCNFFFRLTGLTDCVIKMIKNDKYITGYNCYY